MNVQNPITAEEVIAWLRANTDRQDAGAANVARAIAIFEDAMRKMGRPEASARAVLVRRKPGNDDVARRLAHMHNVWLGIIIGGLSVMMGAFTAAIYLL